MNFHEIHSFLPLPRWLNEAYLQNMMTAPSQEKVMEFKETFTLLSQARCPCRPCRSCRAGFVLTCLLHPPPGANRLTLSLGLSLTFSDKTLQLLPVTCPWCHYHNRDGESMEEYGTMHWHVPHHRRMFVVCLLVCWCLLYIVGALTRCFFAIVTWSPSATALTWRPAAFAMRGIVNGEGPSSNKQMPRCRCPWHVEMGKMGKMGTQTWILSWLLVVDVGG